MVGIGGNLSMAMPDLRDRTVHHGFHEQAYQTSTALVRQWEDDLSRDPDRAQKSLAAVVDHWQSTTLHHGALEEELFYPPWITEKPELQDLITGLIHDHHLMRQWVDEIRHLLDTHQPLNQARLLVDAVLVLIRTHSEAEEETLCR